MSSRPSTSSSRATSRGYFDGPWRDSVRIQPATEDQSHWRADILNMSSEELKRLDFGYQAYLYIDNPKGRPTKLQDAKVSIPALRAVSPMIDSQIRANGPESIVDHIALPPGDAYAYKAILRWLDNMILEGEIKAFPAITKKPLTSYYQILQIARSLCISPITGNLGYRHERMLTHNKGQHWNVQLDDIKEVYENHAFDAEHPLRKRLVENLARAWMAGDLQGKKGKMVENLAWQIEEFWDELEPKLVELGWEG